MAIRQAERERAPLLISFAGKSGSGKTLSALLFAAGLAGAGGKIGFLDTENKRGSMYADNHLIKDAMPKGYLIDDLFDPFSPDRYLQKAQEFEAEGCKVLVVDSMTHEWDGYGGCQDIAENNKLGGNPNWAKAKMAHKRMMNGFLASNMDIIFCLRAQEKTKVERRGGKMEYIDLGVQPIQEKNFIFEMILSMTLDETTHLPQITKCPEPLLHIFGGKRNTLIQPNDGVKLREWAAGAKPVEVDADELFQQALAYANEGSKPLEDFWHTLANPQKAVLKPKLDEAKEVARIADDRAENLIKDKPLI